MTPNEIQQLKGTNVNQNNHCADYDQAMIYRKLCIKEFNVDPLKGVPMHNKSPRHYISAHWIAKFEWLYRNSVREQERKDLRDSLKILTGTKLES